MNLLKLLLILIILSLILLYLFLKKRIENFKKNILTELETEIYKKELYEKQINKQDKIFPINKLNNIPILFINLDRSKDRLKHMLNQIKTYNISNIYRISGVDGSKINYRGDNIGDFIFVNNNFNNNTKSELGCTLSHIKAIKHAYDNNLGTVLIVEDDISFKLMPYWNKSLQKVINNAPKDWEVLQLYNSCNIYNYNNSNKYIEDKKEHCYGAGAYIINEKGQEEISKLFNNNLLILDKNKSNSSDDLASDNLLPKYIKNWYSYREPLFITKNDNKELESTIHPEHTIYHIKINNNILEYYNKKNEKQNKFKQTLFDMDDILSKYNQKYFLACGTCLGAVRENKFIEHDEDIDLGIFIEDYNKDIEDIILKKFNFQHRLGNIISGYEISFIHPETDVKIDIFIHYREKDYIWYPTFFNICDKSKNKMCRWKYNYFNLKSYKFLGRIFNIPEPIENYLSKSYGLDWKIPKKFSYEEGLQGLYKNLIYEDFEKEGIIPEIPTVWQYWENKDGTQTPGYIDYAMKTIKKICQIDKLNYIKVTPENLYKYIDSSFPKNWFNIKEIAHKADYLRAFLLYKYGGLWLDADIIGQNSLKPLINNLENADIVVFGTDNNTFSISIIATRQNSLFIKEWIKLMNLKINNLTKFEWTELGYQILYPLWKQWNKENKGIWRVKIYSSKDTCYPLAWNEWEEFFKNNSYNLIKRNFQPAITLYNNMFPKWFKNLNCEEFLKYINNSNTLIANLYKNTLYNLNITI
jgi:GR25 family glycosyltransferase involved in LPS biosynthesis